MDTLLDITIATYFLMYAFLVRYHCKNPHYMFIHLNFRPWTWWTDVKLTFMITLWPFLWLLGLVSRWGR